MAAALTAAKAYFLAVRALASYSAYLLVLERRSTEEAAAWLLVTRPRRLLRLQNLNRLLVERAVWRTGEERQ